jgi:hypothetical protein
MASELYISTHEAIANSREIILIMPLKSSKLGDASPKINA